MIRRRALAAISLALAAACSCGTTRKLHQATPNLFVSYPAPKVDGTYVLDFAGVTIGSSISQKAIFVNKGDATLTISDVIVDPATSPAFTFDLPKFPVKVAPQGTFNVLVDFAPTELKSDYAGKFTLKSDDPARPALDVKLAGRGIKGSVLVCERTPQGDNCSDAAAPNNLLVDFGAIDLNTSATKDMVVKNVGSKVAHVTSATLLGDSSFTLAPDFAPKDLNPGDEVPLTLTFHAADGHPATATYVVQSDDVQQPRVSVDIKGSGKAPALCPDTLTLDFGSVSVGTTKDMDWNFTSCGAVPLTLSDFSIGAGVFSLVSPPGKPWTLQPGDKAKLTVRYAPTARQADSGFLNLTTNAGNGAVSLKGQGSACQLSAVPASKDFGTIPAGSPPVHATLSVANTGDVACNVTALNGPSPDFALVSPPALPFTIAPNSVQTFDVTFAPQAQGSQSSSLTVVAESSATIQLTGAGGPSQPCYLVANPNPIAFGTVPANTTTSQALNLTNLGTSDCQISGAGIKSGGQTFTVSIPSAGWGTPVTVSSGQSLALTVGFAPPSGGNFNDEVDVLWCDPNSSNPFACAPAPLGQPNTLAIPVSGTGAAAAICVTPLSYDFGTVPVGSTGTLQVQVSSCGQGTIVVQGLAMAPGSSKDFSVPALPGPVTLSAGQSTNVTVTFMPSSSTGQAGVLNIRSNDPARPTVGVSLTGNMASACAKLLQCSPQPIAFPATDIGQASAVAFNCLNAGTSAVTVQSIAVSGNPTNDITIAGSAAYPATVQPGQTLAVSVRFMPTVAQQETANVTVTSDACGSPLVVAASGLGRTPTLPPCISSQPFQPTTKWEWSSSTTDPQANMIWSTPLVANLNDDNGDGWVNTDDIPDVVVLSTQCLTPSLDPSKGTCGDLVAYPGDVRILSGKDGHEEHTISQPRSAGGWGPVNTESQAAIADIDGDNVPDILVEEFYMTPGDNTSCPYASIGNMGGKFVKGFIYAFNADGTFKWVSDPWTSRSGCEIEDGSAITVADLDGDGFPEIIVGSTVWDHNGKLLWQGAKGQAEDGHGTASVAADLDGDGKLEVVAGHTAYRWDGSIMWDNPNVQDGISAVVDLNQDGKPEVLVEEQLGIITILDGQSGAVLGHADGTPLCSSGSKPSGIPQPFAAADVDGDGKIEIVQVVKCESGSGSSTTYTGDDITAWKIDSSWNGSVMWSGAVQDNTGAAGISLFDFEGDGHVDVVYGDEVKTHVFDGMTGAVKYEAPRDSLTGFELQTIADVDNDGHADILVVSDGGGIGGPTGVKALNNTSNDWVGARRIWSEHAYTPDVIYENGTTPLGMKSKYQGIRYQAARCQ